MIEMVVEKIIPSELIIHPGETLADILKERGRKENISKGLALGIERVLGVHLLQTVEFRHSLLPELPAPMWHQFIAAMM